MSALNYTDAVRLIKRGRRAERRAEVVKKLIVGLLTGFLLSLLKGWLLMLAVGVIHNHWIPQCPTIGYWWAVLVMLLMPSLGSSGKSNDD